MTASRGKQFAFLIGRLLAGGIYLSAGVGNLTQLDNTAGYVASKGLPNPDMWVTLASLLLIVGGFSIITGIWPRLGVGALVLFLVPVTLIMHNFWAVDGMQRINEMRSFLGNLALLGSAVMFLAIPRPWSLSLDALLSSLIGAVRQRQMSRIAERAEP